jgi:hypothetical protein
MQKVIFATAIGLAGLANAPVQAMPVAPLAASAPAVTLVAGGCGIGFHRGPYGGCRPNGYYGGGGAVVVGAPGYRYGYGYGVHGGYAYHGGYGYHGGYHYGYHGGYHGGGGGYHYHYHYR